MRNFVLLSRLLSISRDLISAGSSTSLCSRHFGPPPSAEGFSAAD